MFLDAFKHDSSLLFVVFSGYTIYRTSEILKEG